MGTRLRPPVSIVTLLSAISLASPCAAQIQLTSYFDNPEPESVAFAFPAETIAADELIELSRTSLQNADPWQPAPLRADSVINSRKRMNFFDAVIYDQIHFYQLSRLRDLTLMAGVAAVLANTAGDENVRDVVLDNVARTGADEVIQQFHNAKFLGEGTTMLPIYAGVALGGWLLADIPTMPILGEWGERSLRTVMVGAPPLLLMQNLLGASRPGETDEQSEWQPFSDDNGVSGHAFMGAVPLLAAAMMTDDPFLKVAFYAASTLPAISRLTDDVHYPSQVIMGWWIAFLAANAVDDTYLLPANTSVFPLITADGSMGLGLEWRL